MCIFTFLMQVHLWMYTFLADSFDDKIRTVKLYPKIITFTFVFCAEVAPKVEYFIRWLI